MCNQQYIIDLDRNYGWQNYVMHGEKSIFTNFLNKTLRYLIEELLSIQENYHA